MELVYKVVTKTKTTRGVTSRRKFRSIQEWKGMVTYEIGHVTEPIIGKLMVFKELSSASRFAQRLSGNKDLIILCEAEDVEPMKKVASTYSSNRDHTFFSFWANQLTDHMLMHNAPIGTFSASRVKPIKYVAKHEWVR